jgi:hypothetical protein
MKFQKTIVVSSIIALFFAFGAQVSFAQKVTALLKGEAVSSSGGAATDVTIIAYKGTELVNKTKLTPDGKFTIILQPGTQYKLTFAGGKYYYQEENISVPASDKFQTIPFKVTLKELELGTPYQFSNLIFEPKSGDISAAAATELEAIVAAMKRNPKLSITATVYPDEMPSGKKAAAQNELVANRKSALISFFISRNISASNVAVNISTNVRSGGTFERMVTQDVEPVAKAKKKKGKTPPAPAPGIAAKKMMVPQNAEIIMQVS